MIYNLNDPFQQQQAKTRFETLLKRGAVIDLTERRQRTLAQNAYLHVCISFMALQLGETTEYVKRNYYKLHCNRDIFLRQRYDTILGRDVQYLRSSADLTPEETTTTIERFRNFAAELGYYIPSADEHKLVLAMQVETERARPYI